MIKQEIITDKSLPTLKLWGEVLSRLTLHEPTGIVYTYIQQKDLQRYHVNEEQSEGVANFLNFLEEGRAAMVLKEREDHTYKGSFRTTRNDLDVSAWAKLFGGGGHVKAAGFSVSLPLDQTIAYILSSVEKFEQEKNSGK